MKQIQVKNKKNIKSIINEWTISVLLTECNLVRKVLDIDTSDHLIIYEYIADAIDLFEFMKCHEKNIDYSSISKEIKQGIQYIHSRCIAHLDLKPENILVYNCGGDFHIKIIDFGVSTVFCVNDKQVLLDKRVGTPEFNSPEQFQTSYKPQLADIWAFGIILYCLHTSRMPWKTARDSDYNFSSYKQGLVDIFKQEHDNLLKNCLEIDPIKRHIDCEQMN